MPIIEWTEEKHKKLASKQREYFVCIPTTISFRCVILTCSFICYFSKFNTFQFTLFHTFLKFIRNCFLLLYFPWILFFLRQHFLSHSIKLSILGIYLCLKKLWLIDRVYFQVRFEMRVGLFYFIESVIDFIVYQHP